MQLIWLASFPKSGNTWVRFLLYQYFHGEARSSQEIAREIPDLHAPGEYQAAASTPGRARLIAKTHHRCTPTLRGHRYIYIIRHPRDVLLSELNMIRLASDSKKIDAMGEANLARAFLTAGLNPPMLNEPSYGTLEENWKSWLGQNRIPGIVVRYEDLKADALTQLRRMIESIGETFDEDRARRAAALSTFDRLRALEVREKLAGQPSSVFIGQGKKQKEGLFFMNRGQSGRSLEKLAKGLDAECDAHFRETLERFGYTPRPGPPSGSSSGASA